MDGPISQEADHPTQLGIDRHFGIQYNNRARVGGGVLLHQTGSLALKVVPWGGHSGGAPCSRGTAGAWGSASPHGRVPWIRAVFYAAAAAVLVGW